MTDKGYKVWGKMRVHTECQIQITSAKWFAKNKVPYCTQYLHPLAQKKKTFTMHRFTTNQLQNVYIFIAQSSYRSLPFILAIFRDLQVWSMCVVHGKCNLQFSWLNIEFALNFVSHQEHCIGNARSAQTTFQ